MATGLYEAGLLTPAATIDPFEVNRTGFVGGQLM